MTNSGTIAGAENEGDKIYIYIYGAVNHIMLNQ